MSGMGVEESKDQDIRDMLSMCEAGPVTAATTAASKAKAKKVGDEILTSLR